ncbi:hypothetical protein BC332_01474 [Capsicum chinense]|nr:hypothetical protein BC332_01474 [Capsicum chinense]
MPHVLNVWMYECYSDVDSTIAELVGNVIPRIFNWKVVGIKVKYEKFMADMFNKFIYTNLRPTHEEVQRLDLPTIDDIQLNNDESALSHDTYPDRSGKRHAIDIHTQSDMDHQAFEDFSTVPPPKILMKAGLNTHDFERFSSDVGTSTLDAQVEEMVNQEMEDIGTATLNALVDAVVNQNPDYSKVRNPENIYEDHSDEYLSTISESAQLEIDAIMQGLATPIDDIPLEVVKPVDETVNLHSLSDSQITSNYPDSVVAAHVAAKTLAKCTRTRSRIFKSPYTTDFASGSKALEDERTEFKQTFAFEGYGISDDMPSSIIEEYKKWVLEGLLKFHSKKKMNDEHYKAKASSLGVQQYNFVIAHARSKNWFYLMSQKNSCWNDEDYAESVVVADNKNTENNIMKGFSIPAGFPWHLVDEVHVPMNCNQNFHWVLAVIALKDRRIRIYDSLSNLRNMDSSPEIQKLAVMLPTFLSDSGFFEQTSRTDWPNLDAYRDNLSDTTQLLNTNPFERLQSFCCWIYAEYISEGISVPSVDFEVAYHRMRYASLLRNYDLRKAKKNYVNENEDPPRPRRTKHSIPDEMAIIRIG